MVTVVVPLPDTVQGFQFSFLWNAGSGEQQDTYGGRKLFIFHSGHLAYLKWKYVLEKTLKTNVMFLIVFFSLFFLHLLKFCVFYIKKE